MLENFKHYLHLILDNKHSDYIVFFSFDEFFSEIPPENRDYLYILTGFPSSNAILLYSKEQSFYYTDSRYLSEANNFFQEKIQVLNIKDHNFIEKIENKKAIFFTNNLRLDFYLNYKDKIQFNFIYKKEFLEIFNNYNFAQKKLQQKKIKQKKIKKWSINYPNKLLDNRIQDFLKIIKNLYIKEHLGNFKDSLKDNSKYHFNCIFLHDIQFTSWLTGKRANISQNCAEENILFIFININDFSVKEIIEITGNDIHEIEKISNKLRDANIICDKKISYFYYEIIKNLCITLTPCNLDLYEFQSIKNNFEISNLRKAHIYKAKSFNLFEKWIKTINFNKNKISEYDISLKLREFLSLNKKFVDLSFNSIVGANENSALIHYKPNSQKSKYLTNNSIILIDCGGQYKFGTTDMTRMIILNKNNLSKEFKKCYTFVLKAHIQLANTIFLENTTGETLDFIARKEIIKIHHDYGHGTGHGVGFNLNVHEYPSISPFAKMPIVANQVVSIEPGIYIDNKFGIRIENLYIVKKVKNKKINNKQLLCFEALTYTSIDTSPVKYEFLNIEEIHWLENYNKKCLRIAN